jgi:hypothetical protein
VREKRQKHKRVAVALSVSAAVGLFAVLGGTGLAQTALAPAQEVAAQNEPAEKVEICHKGRNTISISVNALPAHLRHGDTESACTIAVPTAGATSIAKPKKAPKADSTESKETSATERTKASKVTKASPAGGQRTDQPAWGKFKKRTGAGPSSGPSVAVKVKETKKAKTVSERGFVPPPGLSGASPPGHANGHGNGKSK